MTVHLGASLDELRSMWRDLGEKVSHEQRSKRLGVRAFAGVDPLRPGYYEPFWKVLVVRPAHTWLWATWGGVIGHGGPGSMKLMKSLALAMWEFEEEASVVLCPRISVAEREVCVRAFHYWQSDVSEVFSSIGRLSLGGASATHFRIEFVVGTFSDMGLVVFSGKHREPPVWEGYSSHWFREGGRYEHHSRWVEKWVGGTLEVDRSVKPDTASAQRTAKRSSKDQLSAVSLSTHSQESRIMSGPWGSIAGESILDKLETKDVEGDRIVLTIERAFIQTIFKKDSGEVMDEFLCLVFREFPSKGLRCNKTMAASFRALQAAGKLQKGFNDIDSSFPWEGLSVPLYKKEVTFDNRETGEVEKHLKLYAVSPAGFDRALIEYPRIGGKAAPARGAATASRGAGRSTGARRGSGK